MVIVIIRNILSRDRVTIDGFWIDNEIYLTQLVTTLYSAIQPLDENTASSVHNIRDRN
jgi:hypothetical protein